MIQKVFRKERSFENLSEILFHFYHDASFDFMRVVV